MRMKLCAVLVAVLAVSCGRERAEAPSGAVRASTPASAPASAPASVVVKHADGSDFLTIKESNGVAEITVAGGQTIRGETKDSGKRKYRVGGGEIAYEVKPGDTGGFKLRMPDGKLRWKVKITPEKIKISDNEENNNPFELKAREGERIKVVAPGDKELGNVRGAEIENAAGKTLFRADSGGKAAYGVLLLDSIPETERYILVAEILARGR